jgi:probable rRNA maturation factor
MKTLLIRSRQKIRAVETPLLRRFARALLEEKLGLVRYELGLHLVASPEMALLNETFLRHSGPTDVITFDHLESPDAPLLHGEIFICLDEAVRQARAFRTTWQNELARYIIHGVLHLRGYDDLTAVKCRVMKREENRLLRQLARQFPLRRFARSSGNEPPVACQH